MNQSPLSREHIYLAALLHDIGKFYQRADEKSFNESNELNWPKKNVDLLCPKKFTSYTHLHVLWTAQFFINHETIFSKVLKDAFDPTMMAAAKHHNIDSGNINHWIVQMADHLASGIDRSNSYNEQEDRDFKQVRMVSVFENLYQTNQQQRYDYALPLSKLVLDKNFFPYSKQNTSVSSYKSLWEDFSKEFASIEQKTLKAFIETVYELLRKYTVTIPASTLHLPDVSLFDHSQMVAAIALCLYDYLEQKHDFNFKNYSNNDEFLLLIGGDLSGIQSYLYNIISKEAAKNLKGRSFYLHALVESVIDTIINELNLFRGNVIYASGGGFYILAPNTNEINAALERLEDNITSYLFDKHKISLFLAIDKITFSRNDILPYSFSIEKMHQTTIKLGEKWGELSRKLNEKKLRRYANLFKTNYAFFFEEAEIGGLTPRDIITNEEILDVKYQQEQKSAETLQQIEIGRKLKNTKVIVKTMSDQMLDTRDEKLYDVKIFDVHWRFYNKLPSKVNTTGLTEVGLLNPMSEEAEKQNSFAEISSGKHVYPRIMFYGGNEYPTKNEQEPKLFEDLVGEEERGLRKLGILRMDVDNLGDAFINGFKDEQVTFSRFATLSRSLDYFFKGYLNVIWKKEEIFSEWISIIYSGGDDVFVVGRWDAVILFAENVYKQFREWTCWNRHLTLSAGMIIVPAKFPLLRAAKLAGEAEDKAKNHFCGNEQKNAICFLNVPLNWEKEFPIVKKYKENLVSFIADKKLPSGFLHRLQSFHYLRQKQLKEGLNQSWIWLMHYYMTRTMKSISDENAQGFVDNILTNAVTNQDEGKKLDSSYHFLELLNVASRWAELTLRMINP